MTQMLSTMGKFFVPLKTEITAGERADPPLAGAREPEAPPGGRVRHVSFEKRRARAHPGAHGDPPRVSTQRCMNCCKFRLKQTSIQQKAGLSCQFLGAKH